jgi:hypothetical protein
VLLKACFPPFTCGSSSGSGPHLPPTVQSIWTVVAEEIVTTVLTPDLLVLEIASRKQALDCYSARTIKEIP